MKLSKLLGLVLLAGLSPVAANAANVTLTLGTAPFKFHPVFHNNAGSLTSNVTPNLLESFKATADGTASLPNGTNTTVGPVRDSNIVSPVPVYAVINAVTVQIGTMTVNSSTGALTFNPF